MFLYDEKGNQIKFDIYETQVINHGQCGEIYPCADDKCLKIYYDSCLLKNRIDKKVYKDLQYIKSKYLVEFYDLFYTSIYFNEIKGYLMKFYDNKELKILELESNYTLYIFNELLKLFNKISSKKIIASDLKRDNCIYDGEKIIIIDPDMFYHSCSSFEYCKKQNYIQLLNFFKSIYMEEIIKFIKLDYSSNPFKVLDELFDIKLDNEVTQNLSKKLKKYKYPKDYFLERK